ncbi:class I SAM-dependent DNA methyltransferase [Neobacillus mesonae]|uniref:SAM-dependent methyltransferase n=1 Tax=Neobacillus mesonae TaxID=1193713 RepID=A0A3T0I217_9BACI|nr:class I SAM-dependent methyltransferase [Neobacillus mesonae]AZU63399.1 SAM-dependent methyltransferase [Neobacillus mesonae]
MSYEQFAYLYDELMSEAPYDEWVRFVKEKLENYGSLSGSRSTEPLRILDLACGTGELSARFAKEGFQVTGVDLSEDMLMVAKKKADAEGLAIPFYQQDMAELEGLGLFDVAGIFCDSLNYLKSEQEVVDTFSRVSVHLNQGGLFIFDVHSLYKVNEVFLERTYALNDDPISYIWNSFPGEEPNSVEHELSFFVLDENAGKYDRIEEFHYQRTFPTEQYSAWLDEAGFKLLDINADFEHIAPQADSERIFYIAQKK